MSAYTLPKQFVVRCVIGIRRKRIFSSVGYNSRSMTFGPIFISGNAKILRWKNGWTPERALYHRWAK